MRRIVSFIALGLVVGQVQSNNEITIEHTPKVKDTNQKWTIEIKNNLQLPLMVGISSLGAAKSLKDAEISAAGTKTESMVRFAGIDPKSELRIDFYDFFEATNPSNKDKSLRELTPRASFTIKPNATREHIFVKLEGDVKKPTSWKLVPQQGGSVKAKFTGVRLSTSGIDIKRNVASTDIQPAKSYKSPDVLRITNATNETNLTLVIEDEYGEKLLDAKFPPQIAAAQVPVGKIKTLLFLDKNNDPVAYFRIEPSIDPSRPIDLFYVTLEKDATGQFQLKADIVPNRRNIVKAEIKKRTV